MKLVLFLAFVVGGSSVTAQPKLVSQVTINTTTNVIAPEEEDITSIQTQGQGEGMAMFRNFGDGETKSVTQVKNNLVKTVIKSDMGRSTIIRNNETKMTTTLIEMMGNKTGFYASDDEQAAMRKSMDSMMQARSKDSAGRVNRPREIPKVEVIYSADTKKIAGYSCKKALIISTRLLGLVKDTTIAWFTPDFKVKNVSSVGGGIATAFGASSAPNPMELIEGFVLGYETKMRRNRTMIVEVTKVDLTKEIAEKEFDIPKDFDVKPMKEMRNMMGGAGQGNQIQIRRGN